MYLCQHGITLKYVSPIEIVIIGGAQFKHMLNIGTVPLSSPLTAQGAFYTARHFIS